MLRSRDGAEFASGYSKYSFVPPQDPKLNVRIEVDVIQTLAVLDTPALFFVCNLGFATQLVFPKVDKNWLDPNRDQKRPAHWRSGTGSPSGFLRRREAQSRFRLPPLFPVLTRTIGAMRLPF